MAGIAYLPNDPLAVGGPPQRTVTPGRVAAAGVNFDLGKAVAVGEYAQDTAEFGYWQARESLLLGLRAWREVTGSPLTAWYGGSRTLPVKTDAGDDLNAFYDRDSLQFFHHQFGGRKVHSCESVDVVCHEEGHALLDAIRPDFFEVPYIEVGAFHEAFGDCMALLSGLTDPAVCAGVVAVSADLSGNHFLESLAEELGDAIAREYGPAAVERGALRHAANNFRWTDPTALPPNAPANQLAGEVHSFARVFVGAWYDTLRAIYVAGPHTAAGLRAAARTAGSLLVKAIQSVPTTPRIFEGVGKRMVAIDAASNNGRNVAAIQASFEAHGMTLGAPTMALPVELGKGSGGAAATRSLRQQLGVPSGTRLDFTAVQSDLHGEMAHVSSFQQVALGADAPGLSIRVPATARVSTHGRTLRGVLGDVSQVDAAAESEARAFARMLLANADVKDPAGPAGRSHLRGHSFAVSPEQRPANAPFPPTHTVRVIAGQPTIVRVGFA